MSFGAKIWHLRYFFGMVLVFAILSGIVLISGGKEEIHLAMNQWHSPFWDTFFKYYTYVGDGVFVALGILVFGIIGYQKYGWRPFAFGWGVLILSGLIAQVLKRFVFDDALRPAAEIDQPLHLVQDLEMHMHNSFPSGHTTAAFAFFGFLAGQYFIKKPGIQVIMAILAATVGYSRMYLSQHFLEDAFTGMLLGSFCILTWLYVDRKNIAFR